jgi:hypothetical protein
LVTHIRDPLPTPRAIWFALTAAPIAWAGLLLIGWWISGQACADGTPGWGSWSPAAVRTLMIVLATVALAIAGAGAAMAYRGWRDRVQPDVTLAAFTDDFRVGFMAVAGVLVSGFFALGIELTGVGMSMASTCAYMR